MQNEQQTPNRIFPLGLSLILLIGIGFVIYSLYETRIAMQKAVLTSPEKSTELIYLENLLNIDSCDLKEMFAQGKLSNKDLKTNVPATSTPKSNPINPASTPESAPIIEPVPTAVESTLSKPAPAAPATSATLNTSPTSLNAKMEQATVFIISIVGDDVYTGSGFFIGSGLVLTNRHVVTGEQNRSVGDVLLINKHLKTIRHAKVVGMSNDKKRDYALLQLDIVPDIMSLSLRLGVERTTKISAWGFPNAITQNDPKYKALLDGNINSSPEVVYSDGVVSVVLDQNPQYILHTAPLSHGNSGGPLVDNDGNVVGINTMITLDDQSYRQTSLALAAQDIVLFLKQYGINPNISKD